MIQSNYQKYRQTSIDASKRYYREKLKGSERWREYKRNRQRIYRKILKLEKEKDSIKNPIYIRINDKLIKIPFTEITKDNHSLFIEWKKHILRTKKYR